MAASRRESRSATTGLNTLQEFENLRKTFRVANDRLAKKNNELLAQISILNKQLQDSAAENFELRGSMSAYQRSLEQQQSRIAAFERERLTMLDLIDELNRANDWTKKNLTSLRRSFDLMDKPNPLTPRSAVPKPQRERPTVPSQNAISKAPDMSHITEGGSEDDYHIGLATSTASISRPLSHNEGSRPTSQPAGGDPLSLTAATRSVDSTVPSATSFPRRPTARRQSGLISALDPSTRVRSSPPPRSTPTNESPQELSQHNQQSEGFNLTEFNPILSPLDVSPKPSHPTLWSQIDKDRTAQMRRSFLVHANHLDNGPSLNDVTNASPPPPSVRKSAKSKANASTSGGLNADTSIIGTSTSPTNERRPKEAQGTQGLEESATKLPEASTTRLKKTNRSSSSLRTTATSTPTSTLSVPQRSQPGRSSSPEAMSETNSAIEDGGRERRARKSVNYAEPKLNTKMRKPDGWDDSQRTRQSLAPTPFPIYSSGSSSPIRSSDTGSTTNMKRSRQTTTPTPSTVATIVSSSSTPPRPRVDSHLPPSSSSPLGDVDEPVDRGDTSRNKFTTGRTAGARDDNIQHDAFFDPSGTASSSFKPVSSSTGTTKPLSTGSASKAKRRVAPSLDVESLWDNDSMLSFASNATAGMGGSGGADSNSAKVDLKTVTRKRKSPSISISDMRTHATGIGKGGDPYMIDDEDSEDGDNDDVDADYVEYSLTRGVTNRRPSVAAKKRTGSLAGELER